MFFLTVTTFRLIKRASADDDDSNANRESLIDFKFTKSETNDTTGWYMLRVLYKIFFPVGAIAVTCLN